MAHEHFPNNLGYNFRFRKTEEHFNELWEMKSSFREHLQDWLTAADVHPHISEICANACSELLENCIKYTQNHTIATVGIYITGHSILVETINKAEQEHKKTLSDFLNKLQTTSDPKQLFIDCLMHPVDGKSQLGLIKVAIETKGILELVEEEDQEIVHVKLYVQKVQNGK
jgi:hypothetical protein